MPNQPVPSVTPLNDPAQQRLKEQQAALAKKLQSAPNPSVVQPASTGQQNVASVPPNTKEISSHQQQSTAFYQLFIYI
jgi:hypothetical protein